MSVYEVKVAGHGLVPSDLLFGGEYLQASNQLTQIRFKAYDELGKDKGFVYLPLSWLLASVVLSILEQQRDGPAEVQFRARLARLHPPVSPSLLPNDGSTLVSCPRTLSPPLIPSSSSPPSLPYSTSLSEKDGTAAIKIGTWFETNRQKFVSAVNETLDILKSTHSGKFQPIVLSDVMSGDARLVGLYASYYNQPIIYFMSSKKAGKKDFSYEYLKSLGIFIIVAQVSNSQDAYHDNFSLKYNFSKGANLTGDISGLLKKKRDPHQPSTVPNGPAFVSHVRTMLSTVDLPEKFEIILREKRPLLVVWTKSKVAENLYQGRPEHLLGNTGTAQICQLGKDCGFAVGVAGDMPVKGTVPYDYDLRYTCGLLSGMPMREQYGALQRLGQYLTIVHVAMRSGNIEPLPLLGMRTIYLEELGSKQGDRMQQLEKATKGFYERHIFNLPPTLKGRMRELVSYYFQWELQKTLKESDGPAELELQRLMKELAVNHLGLSRAATMNYRQMVSDKSIGPEIYKFFQSLSGPQGDASFARWKTVIKQTSPTPRGFVGADLTGLREKLLQLKVESSLRIGIRTIEALKAGLKIGGL